MNALRALDTRSRLLGGALVAALLLLALRFLLLGGGEPDALAAPAPAPAVAVVDASPAPGPGGLPDAAVAEVPAPEAPPKDPFLALVQPGSGTSAGDLPPTAPVVPFPEDLAGVPLAPAMGSSGVDPVLPAPPGPGPVEVEVPVAAPPPPSVPDVPDGSGGPVERPAAGVLALQSVSGEGAATTATFVLDDAVHTAKVGEAFAGLTVRALQQGPRPGQWTAVVQRAGEDPFDLVSGARREL